MPTAKRKNHGPAAAPHSMLLHAFNAIHQANPLFQMCPCALCRYGVAGFAATIVFGMWLLPKDTGSHPREDLLLAVAVGPSSGSSVSHYPANNWP